jgi:hypothetical protein
MPGTGAVRSARQQAQGAGPAVSDAQVVALVAEKAAVSPPVPLVRPSTQSFFWRFVLPLILLCASVVTTTANGARFMQNFIEGMPHPGPFRTAW